MDDQKKALLIFMKSSLLIFFFLAFVLWCHIQESIFKPSVMKVASRVFFSVVFGLTFRSLMGFELIFACGVSQGPTLIRT